MVCHTSQTSKSTQKKSISDHKIIEITISYYMDMDKDIYVTAKENIYRLNDLNFYFVKIKWNDTNELIGNKT